MMHNRRKVKHIDITWDYGNRPKSLFYCTKYNSDKERNCVINVTA